MPVVYGEPFSSCEKPRHSPTWRPGFSVGTASAWQYVANTVTLLAAPVPKLCLAKQAQTTAAHPKPQPFLVLN